MKKLLKNLLFFSAFASVAVLSSCGGDDEPLPAGPSVEVEVEGVNITGTAISAVEGETAEFTITVNAPGNFNTLNISGSTTQSIPRTDASVTLSSEGTVATISLSYTFEAGDVGQDLTWTFEGVDDNNLTGQATITATVAAAPIEVVTFTETLIGGQSNATLGSFYDAIANEVYKYAETRDAQSANVDLLFFYGSTSGYAIASPDDATAATAFSAVSLPLTTFATLNSTKFKVTSVTAEEFDAIGNVDELDAMFGGDVAAEDSNVTGLSADDVFGFTLSDARGSLNGLVKVVETSGTSGTDRAITITVKIQPSEG